MAFEYEVLMLTDDAKGYAKGTTHWVDEYTLAYWNDTQIAKHTGNSREQGPLDVNGLLKPELIREAAKRGLDTTGTAEELRGRLGEAID